MKNKEMRREIFGGNNSFIEIIGLNKSSTKKVQDVIKQRLKTETNEGERRVSRVQSKQRNREDQKAKS
jgi:hypothetical protein